MTDDDDSVYHSEAAFTADYEAWARVERRAMAVWEAYVRIVRGPKQWPASEEERRERFGVPYFKYEYYQWHYKARPTHTWRDSLFAEHRFAGIEDEDERGMAGRYAAFYHDRDDSCCSDYGEGTHYLPLAWLWDDGWQERLASWLETAYATSERIKREERDRRSRQTYEALRRKYEGASGDKDEG